MDFLEPWALSGYLWLIWSIYWITTGFFVHKTKWAERGLRRFQHITLWVLGMFLIFHGRHPPFFGRFYENTGVESIGLLLTFVGLSFSVWARVYLGRYWSGMITLREGHKLIRDGPYQFARHPIYTGLLTAAAGSAMTCSTGDAILGFFFVLAGFSLKAYREEALLTGEFGDEYRRFKAEVPALVPYKAAWRVVRNLVWPERGAAISSDAFGAAALRSERYRITGILLVIISLAILMVCRSLIHPVRHDYQRMGAGLAFYFCAAAYETLMLVIANRLSRAGRKPRPWVWALNTIIECSLPTFALLGLTLDSSYIGPYRALASAPVMFYCFFIILATLRLNPGLCVLSGLVAACGYVGVFIFTLHFFPHDRAYSDVSLETYAFFPVCLLGAGVIAAAVAQRLRHAVSAALQEAETRRKLDRMEFDLKVARSIQMGLLPSRSPSIPGYDIAGFSQPADQTGGDYYDWIELPDGRIIVTIADATGHGIGPALLIAACRAYFRAIAARNDPLERMAAQVDALVAADVSDGRFITAAVALLDPESHRLSLYSAGQAPIYLYQSAADRVTQLDADQPPLGLCHGDADSRARIISLESGDALIFTTDGYFEYANITGEHFGVARVAESIRRHQMLPAARLIGNLHDEVIAFAQGAPQNDDLTAVVIKRL